MSCLPHDPERRTKKSRSGTLLFCDDDSLVRDAFKELLEDEGYSVVVAPDGTAALDLYKQRSADIRFLVTDLMMPGMSGSELYRKIAEIDPSIGAVLCSGYAEEIWTGEECQLSAILTDRVRFLGKPFKLEELLSLIDELSLH